MAAATIRLKFVGSNAIKELSGLDRGFQRLGVAERRLADKIERDAKRAADAREREAKRASQAAEREVAKEEREADKLALHWQRVAEKARNVRIRAERQATAAAVQEAKRQARAAEASYRTREKLARDHVRKVGGVLAAVGAGVGAAALSGSNTARGVAGIKDTATRVQEANEFQRRFTSIAGQAGFTPEQVTSATETIDRVSRAGGRDHLETLGAVEIAQEEFNSADFVLEKLDLLGEAATATGANIQDLTTTMLQARQQGNLTSESFDAVLYSLVAMADKGSVGVAQLSSQYQEIFGTVMTSLKLTGEEGAKTAVAMAEVLKTLGKKHGETATMTVRTAEELSSPETQQKFREQFGVDIKNKKITTVVDELAHSEKWQDAGRRERALPEVVAKQGLETLVNARKRVLSGQAGALDLETLMTLDPQAGRESVGKRFKSMSETGSVKFGQQAAAAQSDVLKNLAEYNKQILAVNDVSMKLEKSFGTLNLWAQSIAGGGLVGGAITLLKGLVPGGSGTAATEAATTATAATGAGLVPGLAAGGALALLAGAAYPLGDDATRPTTTQELARGLRSPLRTPQAGSPLDLLTGSAGTKASDVNVQGEILNRIAVTIDDKRTSAKVTQSVSGIGPVRISPYNGTGNMPY